MRERSQIKIDYQYLPQDSRLRLVEVGSERSKGEYNLKKE